MFHDHFVIKDIFEFNVTNANSTIKQEFELDRNCKFVIGIALTSNLDNLLFSRGSQHLRINETEIYPEKYESKRIYAHYTTEPDRNAASISNLPAGNGKVEIWYTDTDHPDVAFVPYRVSLYVYGVTSINRP